MKNDTIWVVIAEQATRGGRIKELDAKDLSDNLNIFLDKIDKILENTPENLNKFVLEEFEVYAEIGAKGVLTILGTGGETQAKGGLKFVFRRTSMSH